MGGSCGSWVLVKVVGIKKIPPKILKNINKTKGNIDMSRKHLIDYGTQTSNRPQ